MTKPDPKRRAGCRVRLELGGREHIVWVEAEETVFAAARRAGLKLPFSCVSGYCGECLARLEEGDVEMRIDKALSPKQRARGLILTCQSRPTTPECRIRMGE